jgi:zeaxanthin glucosyltransferase
LTTVSTPIYHHDFESSGLTYRPGIIAIHQESASAVSIIAICPAPETGHIQPTLRLAQELKSAGHRVVYWTLPDFQNMLEVQGFETVAQLSSRYPLGTLERLHHLPAAEHLELSVEILLAGRYTALDGEFDELLRTLAPDVVILDILLYGPALEARHRGILAYHVRTSLVDTRAPGVPPFHTSLPYGDTPERQMAIDRAWDAHMRQEWTGLDLEHVRLNKKLMDRYGLSPAEVEDGSMVTGTKTVPELVMCASALDFPRPANEHHHYIESLTFERPPVPFPWERLNPSKPLVYCSLGSQSYRILGAMRFYSEVLAAAASRPDWQFVIVVGSRWSASDFRAIPDNAVLVPFAPQLQLLQRASVVIHHAGLGTIKESIALGVPMVAFPLLHDQPGNGARIQYHGLGEVGDFHSVTAPALVEMLERVRTDREVAARLATMRRAFEEVERRQPGLALITKALAAR